MFRHSRLGAIRFESEWSFRLFCNGPHNLAHWKQMGDGDAAFPKAEENAADQVR
jgi:hypothetical protein